MKLSPQVLLGFRIAQVFAGLILLTLAWHTGKTRVALITEGVRAHGQIVRFDQKSFSVRGAGNLARSTSAFMPVVEFQVGKQTVRFTDWLGGASASGIGDTVPVLYTSSAIIHRHNR